MELIKAKKSLGQNFLVDKNIAKKIVDSLNCNPDDIIIEIGPGTGALSEIIAPLCKELILIEIDQRAIEVLERKFENDSHVKIINADILVSNFEEILKEYSDKKIKLLGNLPYYISSQIIFKIFDNWKYFDNAVIMVQKEFAQRLNAKMKTKDYGILTLAVALYGKAEILFNVPGTCFIPVPKVTSSVVKLSIKPKYDEIDTKSIQQLIRVLFNQRRKVIKNNLSSLVSKEILYEISDSLKKVKIDVSKQRAEELVLQDFYLINEEIKKSKIHQAKII